VLGNSESNNITVAVKTRLIQSCQARKMSSFFCDIFFKYLSTKAILERSKHKKIYLSIKSS